MPRAAKRKRPPLSVEALWSMHRVGSPTLSPDGAWACAPVTSFDMEKNEGSTSLWLFPATARGRSAKGKRLTEGDKDSAPAWSPDGRHVAFTAKRKDDAEPQVYLIAPDGGEARRLTTLATGASAIKWFADGRRIAFVSWVWPELRGDAAQKKRIGARKADPVKAFVTERAEYRYWDHWLADGREPHLFVVDVASGACRDVLAGTGLRLRPWEPAAAEYDIAPDGSEIALTFDPNPEPGMTHRADLVVLNLRTRRWKNLTADSGMSDEHPVYSPDGKAIAYHAYDTARLFNDQGHLRLVDRRTGAWTRLAPGLDRATTGVQWSRRRQRAPVPLRGPGSGRDASTPARGRDLRTPDRGGHDRRLRVLAGRSRDRLRPLRGEPPAAPVRHGGRRLGRARNRAPERGVARAARHG